MTVTTSIVEKINPTKETSTNNLVEYVLLNGKSIVAKEGTHSLKERVVFVGEGVKVERRSPIRKIIKGTVVKKRTLCGTISQGIILPHFPKVFGNEHPSEFEICRRLFLVPPPAKEYPSVIYNKSTFLTESDSPWSTPSLFNISGAYARIYLNDGIGHLKATIDANDFSGLANGRIEIIQEGEIFILASEEFKHAGYTASAIVSYPGIKVISSGSWSSTPTSLSPIPYALTRQIEKIFRTLSTDTTINTIITRERNAIEDFLKKSPKMGLVLSMHPERGNAKVLGMVRQDEKYIIPAHKAMKILNSNLGSKFSSHLLDPVYEPFNFYNRNIIDLTRGMLNTELIAAEAAKAPQAYLTQIDLAKRTITKRNAAAWFLWCFTKLRDQELYKDSMNSLGPLKTMVFRGPFQVKDKKRSTEIYITPSFNRLISGPVQHVN